MEIKATTRKEKLLLENYKLKNELKTLNGEEPIDLENLPRFYREADASREYQLKEANERLQKRIEAQKEENQRKEKTEAYYETEEGKALRARLEEKKALLCKSYDEMNNVALDLAKTWIKQFLGEHWSVSHMGRGYIEFQIWDADKSQFVFGSDIEVRAERDCWLCDGRDRFETNIGSMGSINLMDSEYTTRTRYYMDLGKFLSDKERLENLKRMMFLFEDRVKELTKEVAKVNAELENPLSL